MPCRKNKTILIQKVVIPKGMINPDETTVIEIPADLQKQPVVVAKRKVAEMSSRQEYGRPQSGSSGKIQYRQHDNSFDPQNYSTPRSQRRSSYYEQQRGSIYNMMQMDNGFEGPVNLDKTERQEREQLQRDLEEFQRARRKLYARASFMPEDGSNHKNQGCNGGPRRRLF